MFRITEEIAKCGKGGNAELGEILKFMELVSEGYGISEPSVPECPMPKGCLLRHRPQGSNKVFYFVQMEPGIRRFYDNHGDGWDVAFPYVLVVVPVYEACGIYGSIDHYSVFHQKTSVFYSKVPIESIHQPLLLTNIPGSKSSYCGNESWACLDQHGFRYKTELEAVEDCMARLFSAPAAAHIEYGGSLSHELPNDERISTMMDWQESSLADPDFVFDVPWRPATSTIGSIIDREDAECRSKMGQTIAVQQVIRAAQVSLKKGG